MIWKPNVTVAAVIEREGHFLLVEEDMEGQSVFNQPAGHLEEGETLLEAVTREVLEETAYHFIPQALVAVQLWRHPRNRLTFLRFAFCGSITHHESMRPLDPDILAAAWFDQLDIERMQTRLRSPLVWQSIVAYRNGQRFPLDLLHSFL